MKEKSSKSTKSHQQHNGEVPPFSFNKLLDPEASWDKEMYYTGFDKLLHLYVVYCGVLFPWLVLFGLFFFCYCLQALCIVIMLLC